MRLRLHPGSVGIFAWALITAPIWAQMPRVAMDGANIQSVARQLAPGSWVRIENVPLFDNNPGALEFQRFEVFAPDAEIVVRGKDGVTVLPPPRNVYLSGKIVGDPVSRAVLTVLADGTMRGIVNSRGRYWLMAGGERAGGPAVGLYMREVAPEELQERPNGFHCDADNLPGVTQNKQTPQPRSKGASHATRGGASATYHAKIALDTDFEYFQLFGNTTDATDYAGDLIAYTSTIYEDEVDTSLGIVHLTLWTTAADPWEEFGTVCGLFEFGRYWNDNQGAVDRTLAHFLSGKNNGGGVAWVGVLCSGGFNQNISGQGCSLTPITDNYGGAYGYSGDLDGNFDINSPTSVWDIVVVSHEIGHNFNSPHTMCYAGLEGNPNHVDTCADQCSNPSCFCGANALPSGCPGAGMGCGTIMSYCHFLGGGLGNIGLTLGLNHPFGIAPERVPTRMNNHVVATHAVDPACLDPVELPYEVLLENWPVGVTVIDLINALFNLRF